MKLLKYVTLALVAGFLLYGTGAADDTGDTDIFEIALQTILAVFKNVRYIVYVIGGFGLIGLSVAAMMGKMQFKWLVYIALGLAIVAAADLIVSFATDDVVNDPENIALNMTAEDVAEELQEVTSEDQAGMKAQKKAYKNNQDPMVADMEARHTYRVQHGLEK